jgi:hypothetical protein
MQHTISTTMTTLTRVWTLLAEVNLEGLLDGKPVEIEPSKIITWLLTNKKLNEFCQIVTNSSDDFMETDFQEVIDIVSAFFTAVGNPLRGLFSLIKMSALSNQNQ